MIRIKAIRGKRDAEKLVRCMKVDEVVVNLLSDKQRFYVFQIEKLPPAAVNIIKQMALARGTDAVIHRDVITCRADKTDVVLSGTKKEFEYIASSLKNQPFGLGKITGQILNLIEHLEQEKTPEIMGILNVTPDSFADGGKYLDPDCAYRRAVEMKMEGATIIDVGGQSSRPGSAPVSEEEELNRVVPVLEKLKEEEIVISIDTYRAKVAEAALNLGAGIVNDISAMRFDPEIADVVKEKNARIVLMHMKGTPRDMQENPYYDDVISEILRFFEERIGFAVSRGIPEENIIIDPGIGFGKRLEDNLCILKNLIEFKSFGLPVLLGASRKSFIGMLTGAKVENRLPGSLAAIALGIEARVDIFRVHDVKETKQFIDVMLGAWRNEC